MKTSKGAPTNIIILDKVCRSYFSKKTEVISGKRLFNFLSSQVNFLSIQSDASEIDPELSVVISPHSGLEKIYARTPVLEHSLEECLVLGGLQ